MSINQTKSPIELLEFLETKTYYNLPSVLWDENLFFYNKLLRLMSLMVDDELFNQLLMYKIIIAGEVLSIALYDVNDFSLNFIGQEIIHLKELITHLKLNQYKINHINLIDENIANMILDEPNVHLNYADHKLYRNKKSDISINVPLITIKEITSQNAHLLWEGVIAAMNEGYRYFGGFISEKLVSCAGFKRITKSRSELIAVNTILESDRNKGYASFLCHKLIDQALKESEIVTWTCNLNNVASFKTALRIGMIHFLTFYHFNYDS